jgi:D-alanyl-D-alanine carboxypeptidase
VKYISKKTILILLLILTVVTIAACSGRSPAVAFRADNEHPAFRMFEFPEEVPVARTFAADLCVVPGNIAGSVDPDLIDAGAAAIFAIHDLTTPYAYQVYEQIHPASLTKVMTALVALKYGSLDHFITVGPSVDGLGTGVQKCGLARGDQLTLAQALHLSLINSANDAALVVAEGVAGSVEEFVSLMNREARMLGATNTNFTNPHGLTHDDQFSTVYDLYLIMNAAIKYEAFNQIIAMDTYTTSYMTANGGQREITVGSTNLYLQGSFATPAGVTVLGGKTGTTNAAGHCLVILAKDAAERSHIALVMRAATRDEVYQQMNVLLRQIGQS